MLEDFFLRYANEGTTKAVARRSATRKTLNIFVTCNDKKIEIITITTVTILEICNFVFCNISIEIVAAIAFSKVSTLEVTKQIPRMSKA